MFLRTMVGSLNPTFVTARLISLAVKLAYAFVRQTRFPSGSSQPLWATPLPFRSWAPHSNYPPDTVPWPDNGLRLDMHNLKGGISLATPSVPKDGHQSLPPILSNKLYKSISSCSKAARGLSVFPQANGIFTATAISLGPWLRQSPSRYPIRAGLNLPDKEIRYLRTIIVIADVHWGFGD